MFEELVIRTKLTPPRPRRPTLHRDRLVKRLGQALEHRLTLVHAGTGYGKSTALSALADQDVPLCWYSIAPEDADAFVFMLHLVYAFRLALPTMSDAPLAYLERQTDHHDAGSWTAVIDVLSNALLEVLDRPTLLVLDDYHLVEAVAPISQVVNRLVGYAPDHLHVILSGRHSPDLPGCVVWRARGELLDIDHEDLTFTPGEITDLFQHQYGYQLDATELASVASKTEGWAIALQLIWQGLQSGAIIDLTERALPQTRAVSLEDLFAYLAQEVLDKQSPAIREFLLTTAVLRQLSPSACDAVRQSGDSAVLLGLLHERDLFVVDLSDGQSRYQHLFQEFLLQQLPASTAAELHLRAAAFYDTQEDQEAALYHLFRAGALCPAASLLDEMGAQMIHQGRLDTLAGWLAEIPPALLEEHPALLACLGDIARLQSRFEEALGWYRQAEAYWRARDDRMGASRAIQAQALVYLDTVRPAQAESLLAEALRLSDGQHDRRDRAQLLELLAENKLNLGHPEEADQLRAQAQQWRQEGPSERQIGVRVLIRTGQLARARAILESQTQSTGIQPVPGDPGRAHQSHRETQLLLSLVYAFQGEAEAAFRAAERGIAIGQRLNSPFVTAVGYMRLGHAWLIGANPDAHLRAIDCYQQAVALGDAVAVRRTQVEAQWGLVQAFGFHGDLAAAEEAAALGIEIGCRAGDLWVVTLIELALGASYILAGYPGRAVKILSRAATAFGDCSDTYGRAAAHLWLAVAYLRQNQSERLVAVLEPLLQSVATHGYAYLFTHHTLLGPPDNRSLVPLLLTARRQRIRPATAKRLVADMGLPHIELHPGYQLRVQTLGPFRVWRGRDEVGAREWRRVKARQLFQLLLTHRGRILQREEIADLLWPELPPEAVQRDFKVALNALNKALEPKRPSGVEPAYVERHDTNYSLRRTADLWIDAEEFERLIEQGDHAEGDVQARADAYRQALDLYKGDYLQEALYEDWASAEREHLATLYLRTAEKLAAMRVEQALYSEAIDLCQRILARDDCWERAYRLMMVAYAHQGQRSQALRAYQSCEEALQRELSAAPGRTTRQLAQQIRDGGPILETLP